MEGTRLLPDGRGAVFPVDASSGSRE